MFEEKNFGHAIALLLPGFALLYGLALSFEDIAAWLQVASADKGPTVGGVLYATLASLSLGLFVSAIRWMLIDRGLLRCVEQPDLNFGNLKEKDTLSAFEGAVANHLRYYQYYSNMFTAGLLGGILYFGKKGWPDPWQWIVGAAASLALLCASHDALTKYYKRAEMILGLRPAKEVAG